MQWQCKSQHNFVASIHINNHNQTIYFVNVHELLKIYYNIMS